MSDQSTIFAELVVNLGALAGVTTAGVGVAHIVTSIEPWCNQTAIDHECVGPLLVWNTEDAFSYDSNGEDGWRSMFTLDPNTGIDVWAPILIALATWFVHMPPMDWCIIARSWATYSLWYIFVGIFGNFGYAGNWGVISGYFACGVAVLCLVVNFAGEPDPPASFSAVRELYYLRRERIMRKQEQRRLKRERKAGGKVDNNENSQTVAEEVDEPIRDLESGRSSKKKKNNNNNTRHNRHRNRVEDNDDRYRQSPYEGGWLCYPCWTFYHSMDCSCFGQGFKCFGDAFKSCLACLCRNPFKGFQCSMHTRTGVAFVRLLSAVASFLTVVVGIVHIANTFQEWCEDVEDMTICAGPFLKWNGEDTDFFAPSNQGLRNIVGLAPGVFLELLAPLIFGFIGVGCHFKRTGMYRFVPNWSAMISMHVLTATFANFGYTGNWGICVGFLSCAVALLALLVIITDNAHHGPFVEQEARNGGAPGGQRRGTYNQHSHGHGHGHGDRNSHGSHQHEQSSGETDDGSEYSSMHTAESTRRPSRSRSGLRVDTRAGRDRSRHDRKHGKSRSNKGRDGNGEGGGGGFLGHWLENVKKSATGAMSPVRRSRSKHDGYRDGGGRSKFKSGGKGGRSKSRSRHRREGSSVDIESS